MGGRRQRREFIRGAQENRRDFTVNWVHLKLNGQAQRTVLCKDPFHSVTERVEKLIADRRHLPVQEQHRLDWMGLRRRNEYDTAGSNIAPARSAWRSQTGT